MFKMDFIESLNLNRNISAVLFTMKYSTMKQAVYESNIKAFTALKGIGMKTAMKIIETGRTLLVPRKVKFRIPHYSAPTFTFKQMFTEQQQDLMMRACKATTAREVLDSLKDLNTSFNDDRGVLICNGEPEYNALPFSMLSNLLGIQENQRTDVVCIVKFPLEVRDFIPQHLLNEMNKSQRSEVYKIFEAIYEHILQRATEYGFVTSHGVKYRYYTSSSGQLKKQSGYWMEETAFKKHQNLFWGLLTPQKVNDNCGGKGIPMTKILQYRALLTSSSIPSSEVLGKPIKLRNLICVPEITKMMNGNVMSVSASYEVMKGIRNDIENNMFDGMVLLNSERVGWTMLQLRGFGIKGLGVPADWRGYCEAKGYTQHKDCWFVTDVDGIKHDLSKETHIYGIVNTSVFKMLKMFGSWKHYVECMEKLGMDELYICSINEESSKPRHLSRQMTQSLFALNNDELEYMANDSLRVLSDYSNIECATQIMGETDRDYEMRSNLGKLASVYPDILAVSCVQKELKDRYTKQYNAAMSGELRIEGKYLFVAADPCAYMDIEFGKKDPSDPSIGFLLANECCCDVYKDAFELIVLRSPHAFMEWVTLRQAKHNEFVQASAIYTSVHDLTFRIVQMDYDGDHLLVVNDKKLISIVKRIKKEYDIPVVYYEPSVAPNPGAMPTKASEFSARIVECIQKCAEYNKVGQYSNFATAAWSTYRPGMSKQETEDLLKDVAIIAAGINHAVDAQKTYSLNLLEEYTPDLVERYKFKPFNERFKNANTKKPNYDPAWDEETAPKGLGSVDRLGDVVKRFADDHLELDTSSLKFDWKMMQRREPQYNVRICRASVSPEVFASVIRLFAANNNEAASKVIEQMREHESVSFNEFVWVIKYLNNAFFAHYRETEDDEVDIKLTHLQRIRMIRDMIIEFVRKETKSVAELTNEEILITAANSILKETYRSSKYQQGMYDMRRFIFDTFGDLYAEAVLLNVAADYNPSAEEEYDEPPFNPDELDVPPVGYGQFAFNYDDCSVPDCYEDLDAFLSNAMDDVQ